MCYDNQSLPIDASSPYHKPRYEFLRSIYLHNIKKDLMHIAVSGAAQDTVKHLLGLTYCFLVNWIGGLSQE